MPAHVVFLCTICPIVGLLLFHAFFAYALLPLLYPLAAGFALIAAIGLYELSRRRELGLDTSWRHDIIHSPSLAPVLALGRLLFVIFGVWIMAAHAIYVANFGNQPMTSASAFVDKVLTTQEGGNFIIFGNAIGFLFALTAASVSVISFLLLLDRHISLTAAVLTSLRVVAKNPTVMATWFLIVSIALFIGSLPLLIGLAIVLPILGHATWHLYREAVEPAHGPRSEYRPSPQRGERHGAQFPSALFFPSSDVIKNSRDMDDQSS